MTKKVFDIYKEYLPRLWNIYGRGKVAQEEVPQALRIEYESISADLEKKYSNHITQAVLDEIVKMIEYLEYLNQKRGETNATGIPRQDCQGV